MWRWSCSKSSGVISDRPASHSVSLVYRERLVVAVVGGDVLN